ncbi:ABC transporter ATP-binding protein [Thalassotalea sp. 1_MG-2023]|uniref:ABC transporter ATP-binding protein n=1 Tax=Thalassotalea sp. 1_MG-2023 TaxID=3062680 RepID=UPI0026E16E68|nr:ABC transporter ATP-binding protein [Thalassotalea sp. 1_MG-2023]MDO6428770.1 ABC transporter ATP-binding protein [Thalassotalea sp. 1_MG-2023]
MSAVVSLKQVSKYYKKTKVVDNVDLSVEKGQILGLVGPNGAGKTTCLQAMLGLISYQGEIDILGFEPRKNRAQMLENVAYIADVAVLPKWLTAAQAIKYMAGVHPKFNADKARSFLAKTNIKESSKVGTLSKGMITQLHLALILALEVSVLILDEPTLGLDILTRRQFYSHLLEDFYTEDKAIVVTTHQIEEIEHILTDVAFIQDGKVIIAESVEQIKNKFKLVAVSDQCQEQACDMLPLCTNRLMGITTMLFDQHTREQLEAVGKVSTPSLADIFVGVMAKEVY